MSQIEKEVQETKEDTKVKEKSGTPGTVGFVCGLLSLILPVPIVDIILGIIGIVGSGYGMQENRKRRGLAIAGLVLSILGLLASIWFNFIFSIFFFSF